MVYLVLFYINMYHLNITVYNKYILLYNIKIYIICIIKIKNKSLFLLVLHENSD